MLSLPDAWFSTLAQGGLFTLSCLLISLFYLHNKKEYLFISAYLLVQSIILLMISRSNYSGVLAQQIITEVAPLSFLMLCSTLFILLFSRIFIASNRPFLSSIRWACYLVSAALVAGLFLPAKINFILSHSINTGAMLLLLAICIALLKSAAHLSKLFFTIVLLQSALLLVNIASFSWFEFNAVIFSAFYWLFGMLLVFLLTRQLVFQLKEQSIAAETATELATKSEKAYQELLVIQEENQEQLEVLVQERTLELHITLQELEEANGELEKKSTIDELTGLFNRRFYDQKIIAEFRRSRRNLTPLSLVIIDIDYFKKVNDNYGHAAGDTCLTQVAKYLQQVLRRSSDIGCRYGGEEFCLILPETDAQGASALAEELRILIENQVINIDNTSIKLTISCGISTYQQQADMQPVDIFKAADKALYQAKNNGRNQIQHQDI